MLIKLIFVRLIAFWFDKFFLISVIFLIIATLLQLIRTMVTLVSHAYKLFQLVLLVDTAYAIVNMIQVINKEGRET